MRKLVLVVLASIVAATAMLALSGCDQSSQADKAIAEANKQVEIYNQLDQEMSALLKKAGNVQPDASGAKEGITLLDQVDAKLVERKKATEAAKASFSSIASMNVDENVKAYAAKEVAVTEALLVLDQRIADLTKAMRALYQAVVDNQADVKKVQGLSDAVDAATKQLDAAQTKVNEATADADAYYQANIAKGK
jgi:DNA repair exonuclease SbcCD ATPase subunit